MRRAGRAAAWLVAVVACGALLLAGCGGGRELVDDNDALYREAMRKIAQRKFLEATRVLGDIGLVAPLSDELAPKVKIALADAYFYQPGTVNVVEAQSRYEQFLAFYPLHESASYARYQVGACLLRQAESPENDQEFSVRAVEHFERMGRELPGDDPWRRAALEMLVRAQERLAEHEWLVAKFYLDREQWAGAGARLGRLIERYPGAVRREEAFYELARAQLEDGAPEKALVTLDRMLREYPAGSLVERARALRARIAEEPDSAAPPQGQALTPGRARPPARPGERSSRAAR